MNREQRDWLAIMLYDGELSSLDRRAIQAAVDLWDRLPKTAEGDIPVPGNKLWLPDPEQDAVEVLVVLIGQPDRGGPLQFEIEYPWADFGWCNSGEGYSTREAALAIKGADPAPSA